MRLTSRTIHRLAMQPWRAHEFIEDQKFKASSPLITLLESLSPRDLVQITNVRVGIELGYEGCRFFGNGALALKWLQPAGSGTPVSESWRNKRFQKRLTIENLAHCARIPDSILRKYTSQANS